MFRNLIRCLCKDREEGTWKPQLQFGGANVGMTTDIQSGHYIRVGKLIVCFYYFALSAKGTSTGTATLAGFPFPMKSSAAGGDSVFGFVHMVSWNNMNTAYVLMKLIEETTDSPTARFRGYPAASTGFGTTLLHTDFTDTSSVNGTFIYTD